MIRITERENGLLDETIALIRGHLERVCMAGVRVLVWSSTPCTGGCVWQFLNRKHEGFMDRLKKVWGIQRKLWKGFEALVSPLSNLPEGCHSPYLAIEWPKTCQYWLEDNKENRGQSHEAHLQRDCAWLLSWHGWGR